MNLDDIRIDGGTQPRTAINTDTVSDYAEAIEAGAEFRSVVVFFDGKDNWLADGFHRYHAHRKAGKKEIAAEVRNGTLRDAILYSVGANAEHGLRRTNEDKRRSVLTLLKDAEWVQWSNYEIAKACAVNEKTVRNIRKEQEPSIYGKSVDAPPEPKRRAKRGGTEYEVDTSNIGSKSRQEAIQSLPTFAEMNGQPEEPPEDDAIPVVDDLKRPVPDHLVGVFEQMPQFKALNKELGTLKGKIKDLCDGPGAVEFKTRWQDFETHIKNAQSTLKFATPYTECPRCKGKPKDGCDVCRGYGFIVRGQEGRLTDADKRWLGIA